MAWATHQLLLTTPDRLRVWSQTIWNISSTIRDCRVEMLHLSGLAAHRSEAATEVAMAVIAVTVTMATVVAQAITAEVAAQGISAVICGVPIRVVSAWEEIFAHAVKQ